MDQEYIAGLDIGTTKICTVVATVQDTGDLDIVGVGNVPAHGVSKGTIVDIKQAAQSVRESVQAASQMAGFPIDKALVGVTGTHVEAENLRCAMTVGTAPNIRKEDVVRAFESAIIRVPRNREILHLEPRDFVLDGQRGIASPLGMNASRLEAVTHMVTADSNALKNVTECAHQAGIEAQALVLEPIATSEAVISADERALGAVVIDIGGGTTDIAVFCNGALYSSIIIPVGGNHVTRDISIGLRTPFDIAEQLKIESGSLRNASSDDGMLQISSPSGDNTQLPRTVLTDIIEPRMSELFEMAYDAMRCDEIRMQLSAGIILTGGGALLPGAVELASRIFNLPTRLGQPTGMMGWTNLLNSPKFSTSVGLLHYAKRLQNEAYAFAEIPDGRGKMRRIWSVPQSVAVIRTATQAQREITDEKAPDTLTQEETPPAKNPKTPRKSTSAKQTWKGFAHFVQPAMDRVRQWIGFDID